MAEAIAWLMLGACIGIPVGAWLRDGKWTGKGDQGYPQMLARGALYWVSREDVRCVRCDIDRQDARIRALTESPEYKAAVRGVCGREPDGAP